MIREGKIGFTEGFALIFISYISKIFLVEPSLQIETAKNMAWLLVLFGVLLTLVEFWIIVSLMKRHKNSTIIETSEELLGPYLGILCSLSFGLFFIVEEAILIRRYAETLIMASLPETPISVVMVILTLAAVISCYYGIEAMARVSRISLTFILLGIVVLFVAVTGYIDMTNFYPLWSVELVKLLVEYLPRFIIFSEGLLAVVLFQTFGSWQNCRSAGLLAIACGGFIRLSLVVLLILTFGVEIATEKSLPFFNLSRLVSLGSFFQRAESVFLLTWAMVGFLKLALNMYAATVILARVFRLPDYRPLIWVVSLLCFSLSIIPKDLSAVIALDVGFFKIWGIVPTIILPILLLLVSLIRKPGKKKELEPEPVK